MKKRYSQEHLTTDNAVTSRQSYTEFSAQHWLPGYGLPNGIEGDVGIIVFNTAGAMVIGGGFLWAGDVKVNYIAKWNGNGWSALGAGLDSPPNVILPLGGDSLLVGGNFTHAGDSAIAYIALWDGAKWSKLCNPGGRVHTILRTTTGELYIGGAFDGLHNIGKWNGTCWSPLGSGVNDAVSSIVEFNNALYVSGVFTVAGGQNTINGFARWSNNTWQVLGSPAGGRAGMFVHNNELYVVSGSVICHGDGSVFWKLPIGFSGINTYELDSGNNIYAGGLFGYAGTEEANSIARYDGTTWHAMKSDGVAGLHSIGYNLIEFATSLKSHGSDLYVSGTFWLAGNTPATRIARWDGERWNAITNQSSKGVAGTVQGMAIGPHGERYVGGYFTQAGDVPSQNIAYWNGSKWDSLGGCVKDGGVNAIVYGKHGEVYIGGCFTKVGDTIANNIAMWDGAR